MPTDRTVNLLYVGYRLIMFVICSGIRCCHECNETFLLYDNQAYSSTLSNLQLGIVFVKAENSCLKKTLCQFGLYV